MRRKTLVLLCLLPTLALASDEPGKPSANTTARNAAVLGELPFANEEDFALAQKGFLGTIPDKAILNKDGRVVFQLDQFDFLKDKPAPATVNPSLWRQSQLVALHGLFKVTDKIYQVRGFDVANMTLVEGKTGWILIDTLTTAETAAAALKLANDKLGKRPVKAVIFTHSHIDHFGGVLGVVSAEDVKSGRVQLIAPEGFLEEAVSENVYAGNAMTRRAQYMYGNALPKNPTGVVSTGLGPAVAEGSSGILVPNKIIRKTGTKLTVDGVEIVFQNAPGTEAPAEMMFYFPQFKALCLSEDATATLHNLYTLRGAKVRSPYIWAKALNETLALFGDKAEVSFASHHWPRWGSAEVKDFLTSQRDLYKFIHDQTLRLANHGYNMNEIAEQLRLPPSLAQRFYNRGYYGTVSHNAKATYQLYLGFFDGNPATLHPHPRQEAGRRYVDAIGGAKKLLAKAREAYKEGDYRWTAELVNHLVYAEPENQDARQLQASALEQLGFQAESGPWRDFYLTGAQELRSGGGPKLPVLIDTRQLPLPQLFDYTAIRLNGDKALGKKLVVNLEVTGAGKFVMTLNNSVLFFTEGEAKNADQSLRLKPADVGTILGGYAKAADLSREGKIRSRGKPVIDEVVAMLDTFDTSFPLVTPVGR